MMNANKGGFPLSRNFQMRKQVNFTRVNKIEAGTSRVNVKVEPRSSLTFTCIDLLYIAFILFTHLKFAFRKNHAPVDSQTKSWYTFLFSPLSSQLKKKTLNQKQVNKGKSIGRTGSVVRIVRKGKKVARADYGRFHQSLGPLVDYCDGDDP